MARCARRAVECGPVPGPVLFDCSVFPSLSIASASFFVFCSGDADCRPWVVGCSGSSAVCSW